MVKHRRASRWASAAGALVLALLCPLLAWGAEVAEPTGSGPRLSFGETKYDFGGMYQEETVTHEFAFRNTGNETLVIDKVTSSCGCTGALPSPREVAPGGRGVIKVEFRSGGMRNRVTKHIYVQSNDAAEPRAVLTITALIKVEIEATPSGVYLGQLKVGESVERKVTIRPVEVRDFRILRVTSGHPAVHVRGPRRLPGKDLAYEITVRFGPLDKAQRVTAAVLVHTNLEHTRELRISVYGKVGDPGSESRQSGG